MQFLPELVQTKDGKSSRDGKPDQSESANRVEAQLILEGSIELAVSRKLIMTHTRELVHP